MGKQYEDEELELGKIHTTMVNMTLYDAEEESYIIDIKNEDNRIKLYYADGKVQDMGPYSLHNMNFYRLRAQRQFREFYDKYMDQCGIESLKLYAKKYGSVALDAIGLYFLYNFDIHIVIKILISLIMVGVNIFYYFLKHYDLLVLSQELDRVEALELYLDNVREFMVYNEDQKEDDYSLAIEDIWQNDLHKDEVRQIIEDAKTNKGNVLKYDVKKYKKSKDDNVV